MTVSLVAVDELLYVRGPYCSPIIAVHYESADTASVMGIRTINAGHVLVVPNGPTQKRSNMSGDQHVHG